jgi:hypothetical protein
VTDDRLALAEIHLDLLYETDDAGLILRSRDHDVGAPMLHLVRTIAGNRWLVSAALSARERLMLHDALANEPVVRDLDAMQHTPPLLLGIRELLHLATDTLEVRGPAYHFPRDAEDIATSIEVLREPRDASTVHELAWLRSTGPREQPLCVARNAAGAIVSLCHSARSTRVAAEAGVETAPAYRGRGLAAVVVAGWATVVSAEGRVPIYSTQWSNHASRAVASKLGLVAFGEDCHIG